MWVGRHPNLIQDRGRRTHLIPSHPHPSPLPAAEAGGERAAAAVSKSGGEAAQEGRHMLWLLLQLEPANGRAVGCVCLPPSPSRARPPACLRCLLLAC